MKKAKQQLSYLKGYISTYKKPKVLFVWIPKNAGTSTYEALKESINMKMFLSKKEAIKNFTNQGAVTFGHISVNELRSNKIIKQSYCENAYIFCISRNPYDRFVSLLHYLKKQDRIPKDYKPIDLINQIIEGTPPVGLYNLKGISQCNPQVTWIEGLDVNRVLRFEDLEKDTYKLAQDLNIHIALPHENKSENRKKFYNELDEMTIQLIQKYYKDDFERFNYSLSIN